MFLSLILFTKGIAAVRISVIAITPSAMNKTADTQIWDFLFNGFSMVVLCRILGCFEDK